MSNFDGCQLPCVPHLAEGRIVSDPQPLIRRIKRSLAVPWNYYVKRWMKTVYRQFIAPKVQNKTLTLAAGDSLNVGDRVRVRSWPEIQATLDPFKELKGCAFLAEMEQLCGTTQTVLQVMERFLDERDYKVKKVRGVVLLEGVLCHGTPVFGRCDRCCHLFWRQEWLEKI